MTDEAFFQRALDANPDDHACRLMLADFLDEEGDARASGYRWLGANGKRPKLWPSSQYQWTWWCFDYIGALNSNYDELSPNLFNEIKGESIRNEEYLDFPTRQAAEDAFCAAYLVVQRAEAVAAREMSSVAKYVAMKSK